MKLLIFFIVGYLFYMLNRGYKAEDYMHIKINKKQTLQGNLEDHEGGILIALMAKVAKADGQVCELEAELLSHTFTDISSHFENSDEIREQLKVIYKKEMESFDNTVAVAKKYYNLTKRDYRKRVQLLEYLLNLAFIDADFSKTEFMIIEDIANTLEIKRNDLERLVAQFEQFYAQAKNNKVNSLENAYKVLDVSSNDSDSDIKKAYRKLVRINHPDIIMGQGAEQSIIDEATRKLQEINEAYELIKKERK